jgi:hypothetical protein
MTRTTTQLRYKAVLKDFDVLINKRVDGKQLYSYEYIISVLSKKHFYSEFMITRIIQKTELRENKQQPIQVQLHLQ